MECAERCGSRLPVLAQDALLGLFVAVMQVQGTVAKPQDVGARPLTDFGYLGYVLLVVSGLALAARRRWPVPVFITAALASLAYYAIGFSDGPGWIGLFVALYTLTAYGDGRGSLAIAGVGITALATGWLIGRGRHRAEGRHRLGVLPDRGVGHGRCPGRVGSVAAGHRGRGAGARTAGGTDPGGGGAFAGRRGAAADRA